MLQDPTTTTISGIRGQDTVILRIPALTWSIISITIEIIPVPWSNIEQRVPYISQLYPTSMNRIIATQECSIVAITIPAIEYTCSPIPPNSPLINRLCIELLTPKICAHTKRPTMLMLTIAYTIPSTLNRPTDDYADSGDMIMYTHIRWIDPISYQLIIISHCCCSISILSMYRYIDRALTRFDCMYSLLMTLGGQQPIIRLGGGPMSRGVWSSPRQVNGHLLYGLSPRGRARHARGHQNIVRTIEIGSYLGWGTHCRWYGRYRQSVTEGPDSQFPTKTTVKYPILRGVIFS